MYSRTETRSDLSLIIAVAPNGITAFPRDLPSHVERLESIAKRAGVLIVGNGTYQEFLRERSSLFAERRLIVFTRDQGPSSDDFVRFVNSVDEMLDILPLYAGQGCIIGGAGIIPQLLPYARIVNVTNVPVGVPMARARSPFPRLCRKDGWRYVASSEISYQHRQDPYESSFHLFSRTPR